MTQTQAFVCNSIVMRTQAKITCERDTDVTESKENIHRPIPGENTYGSQRGEQAAGPGATLGHLLAFCGPKLWF